MPYLVLAFGCVMSVIGVVSVAFGYPIIQIERGWAMVIAGATLFAGGAVIATLGLILKAMLDLKHLAAGRDIGVIPTAAPLNDLAETFDFRGLDLPDPAPVAHTAPAVDMPAEVAPIDVALPLPHDAAMMEEPAPGEPSYEAEPEVMEPAPAEAVPVAVLPAPPEPPPVPKRTILAPIRRLPRVSAVTVPPPAPAPDPVEASAGAPPMGDWLDQSFAEFDRETVGLVTTAPAIPEPVHDPRPAHDPEPPPEPEPAPHPLEPVAAPDVAIIGRYEADGTSYVMYADGSIDAQSPSGVRRFASMAELRAFIEG